MAEAFVRASGTLADRLLAALDGGQAAGGDRRGMQAAALLVVRENGGYAGLDDRLIDLSVADHRTPIAKLRRLYKLHSLTFFAADPDNLVAIDDAVARELQEILHHRGLYPAEPSGRFDEATRQALRELLMLDNFLFHLRDDDRIDRDLLDAIRHAHRR